jgi:hypothetical protein
MGPRAGVGDVEKNFLTPSGLELQSFGRPARSQPLYRLRYYSFIYLFLCLFYYLFIPFSFSYFLKLIYSISSSLPLFPSLLFPLLLLFLPACINISRG